MFNNCGLSSLVVPSSMITTEPSINTVVTSLKIGSTTVTVPFSSSSAYVTNIQAINNAIVYTLSDTTEGYVGSSVSLKINCDTVYTDSNNTAVLTIGKTSNGFPVLKSNSSCLFIEDADGNVYNLFELLNS